MLEALKSISQPGPSSSKDSLDPIVKPAIIDTNSDLPSETEVKAKEVDQGAVRNVESEKSAETTDDEMDEDAVLLRRPSRDL
jgi:hypothetical protein